MIVGFSGFHHLDGLVKMRIKGLALCRDRLYSHFGEGVLQLLVDELHTVAKLTAPRRRRLQRPLKTIQDGQQAFYHVRHGILAKLLLLAGSALARSEEHTSELQSRQYLVCRLLLEKKK